MTSTLTSRLRRWLRPQRRLAIFEACLIGFVSALAAVLLKVGVGWIGTWRVQQSLLLPAWFLLPCVGLICGFLAGLLVERVAPETSGSGIPQVKAVLARVPMALDLRVALVKLIGGILALGSGLALGREGPTVQVGAALAAQLSRWFPTSPDHRRQLIAAGAGAGLAAAFNTPIAGVLFVVEELLQDFSGITLGTAILASFIGAVVSRLLGGRSLDINFDLSAPTTAFFVQDIPFYLVLGVLAGVLGVFFNRGVLASLTFYRRVIRVGLPARVGLAGLISGIIVALLPLSFRDNTGLREILITGEASWSVAAIALLAQLTLTLVAYGSGAPGGLFAPTLTLGSALGYLVGVCAHSLLATIGLQSGVPITYALAGMGTFFSAVARVPVTAIVIVFEMTTNFNLVLPLMIGSVTAYLVADLIEPGSLYDRLLEWNGIHLEKDIPSQGIIAQLTAADVMQRRVETLSSQLTLDEAVQAFSRSHHRGFPVVESGKLVGIVTQTDLASIAQRQLSGDMLLEQIMTPHPLTVNPIAPLSNVLYLLNHYQLSRLPVIEGRKLVGIITRGDIIRAEVDQLTGETNQVGPQPEPSYVVYQTRAPAVGQGRLLVPLANPQTAGALLELAATIARDRHYELECLQVIVVPRHKSPTEATVNTTNSRRLLSQAESLGRQWLIPVHTQVRVTHDVGQAVLETIKERHIDLIVMGWKGNTITPGRIFGDVVDTLIRQAPCDVVLVKMGQSDKKQHHFNRWLVPMAGGPNARAAIQFLPSLVKLGQTSEIQLCQVFEPSNSQPDLTVLEQASRELSSYHLSNTVSVTPIRASSVSEGVINLVKNQRFDVVVLGASREGLLQQAIKGNIPAAIALQCESTVILVRGHIN